MNEGKYAKLAAKITLSATLSMLVATAGQAAPGSLSNSPLFLSNSVKPNIILSLDDSGSMDFEVLFQTNDGALWWNTGIQSFVGNEAAGQVNFNTSGSTSSTWKKYVYLFPNGTGITSGKRGYGDSTHDHYAIPPLPQYAFLRSPEYNASYFNPNTTYSPWVSNGSATFSNATATAAKSDPALGTFTFNLTANIERTGANEGFYMQPGMRIPAGVRFHNGTSWVTTGKTIATAGAVPISYYAPTYYLKTTTGSYSLGAASYDCNSPSPANYTAFHTNPDSFSSSSVNAIAPDGACLKQYTINSGDSLMQSYANWFQYYRKRHLSLRAGIGKAFDGLTGTRLGKFTINNRVAVTMRNFDAIAERKAFYDDVYDDVNTGGTPNREGLDHAGNQFDTNTSIITEPCQKCYAVVFTDGYSTTGYSGVGNSDGSAGAPYQDSYSNTLGDVAHYYYNKRLRTDLSADMVPVPSGCDEADPDDWLDCRNDLHMNTYSVGLGNLGTLFGITHNTVMDAYTNPPTWPDATATRDPRMIDDLYHAAVNGRGEMFNARTPEEIGQKMSDVLSGILAQSGSAAAVTFNSSTLGTNSAMYLALFDSANWSGHLLSYPLDSETGVISASSGWDAGEKLNNSKHGASKHSTRKVYTYNRSQGGGQDFTDTNWAKLTTAMQNDLKTSIAGTQEDETAGKKRLNYLRGDDTYEGNGFRKRLNYLLGDIVHSGPVYVGKPALRWPSKAPFGAEGARYSDFKNTYANIPASRPGTIYIGANDGMLHAFDEQTGEERFAYVPNFLASTGVGEGLHALTEPNYSHRYYVDLTPSISDVYLGAWKTVMVGGARGGGRGLFALDVTNPDSFGTGSIMWEFSSADNNKLGYTFSKPIIALLETANNTYRWAAIVGNGYNGSDTTGAAHLFVLFLDANLTDGTWDLGLAKDYYVISTPASTEANGLSTPTAVDYNFDGIVDRVYAGDLLGNMWAFDLSAGKWDVAYKSGATGKPLFKTQTKQAITSRPMVIKHPSESGGAPNLLVMFGTGQYLVEGDKTTTNTQAFYGVWDNNPRPNDLPHDISDLQQQTVSNSGTLRSVTNNSVNWATKAGWYLNLPDSKERLVTDPLVRGTIVYFNTMVPESDPCKFGGYGWLMSINTATGGRPEKPVFDSNNDGLVNDSDKVSGEPPIGEKFDKGLPAAPNTLGDYRYTPGTTTQDGSQTERDVIEKLKGNKTGRLSWEEL